MYVCVRRVCNERGGVVVCMNMCVRRVCNVCTCVYAGFAMNVVALLPYLVEHYDEPSSLCIDAAISIAQVKHSLTPPILTYLLINSRCPLQAVIYRQVHWPLLRLLQFKGALFSVTNETLCS